MNKDRKQIINTTKDVFVAVVNIPIIFIIMIRGCQRTLNHFQIFCFRNKKLTTSGIVPSVIMKDVWIAWSLNTPARINDSLLLIFKNVIIAKNDIIIEIKTKALIKCCNPFSS
tara:strand:- start:123 stop:461 length:339 start_codon:yes stop_codon:yes gene_type:complete